MLHSPFGRLIFENAQEEMSSFLGEDNARKILENMNNKLIFEGVYVDKREYHQPYAGKYERS